jgi:hypothetical protein
MNEDNCPLSSADSQAQLTLFDMPEVTGDAQSSGKMYQECCPVRITHSAASWLDSLGSACRFSRQGTDGRTLVACMDPKEQLHGGSSMPNISAWPNDAAVCGLSQVLETGAIPAKYFLSAKACAGILRRAEKRGKDLPQRQKPAGPNWIRVVVQARSRGRDRQRDRTLPPLCGRGRRIRPH